MLIHNVSDFVFRYLENVYHCHNSQVNICRRQRKQHVQHTRTAHGVG